MSKKSFKELNPALQFISATAAEEDALPPAQSVQPAPQNPARPSALPPRPQEETKSKRLNLLLQPSVLDGLAKIARMKQTSVNDMINTILREYRDQQASLIVRYQEVFGLDARAE